MNLQNRKLSLIDWLISLDDEAIIHQIEGLKKRKNTSAKMKPMTLKEYHKMIEESEEDVKAGRVYAHEDVVKYLKRKK